LDPKFVKYDLSMHAEVAAILKLPEKINYRKITLIVVRKGLKMSKPCKLCTRVLEMLGIHKIYYSCEGTLIKM